MIFLIIIFDLEGVSDGVSLFVKVLIHLLFKFLLRQLISDLKGTGLVGNILTNLHSVLDFAAEEAINPLFCGYILVSSFH